MKSILKTGYIKHGPQHLQLLFNAFALHKVTRKYQIRKKLVLVAHTRASKVASVNTITFLIDYTSCGNLMHLTTQTILANFSFGTNSCCKCCMLFTYFTKLNEHNVKIVVYIISLCDCSRPLFPLNSGVATFCSSGCKSAK